MSTEKDKPVEKDVKEEKKPAKDDKELSPEELARVTGAGTNAAYYTSRNVGGTDPAGPPAKDGTS